MMRGFLNIELNDFDQAYNDLHKAILANPENEEHFRRGETILDKRIDIQFATSYAMRFSYGLDETALNYFKKGFCFFLADKNEKATENFKASAKVQPSSAAFFLQALTFEYMGEHDSAYRYYDKALALDNDIIDAHKKRALYRYSINDWKGAYTDLNEMSKLQPDLMVTYRLRGLIKASQKDFYGAILDFAKYLKSDSTDYEIWLQRGSCRSHVNDIKGANEDYLKALKYDRLNWKVYELVTDNYLQMHDTTHALSTLKLYSTELPERISPPKRQAEIFIHQHKWDSALHIVEQAIKRFHPVYFDKSEYSKVMTMKGIAQFNLQRFEAAVQEFNKALDINPSNLEALYFRGKTYLKIGIKSKAVSDFKRLSKNGYRDAAEILQSLAQQ